MLGPRFMVLKQIALSGSHQLLTLRSDICLSKMFVAKQQHLNSRDSYNLSCIKDRVERDWERKYHPCISAVLIEAYFLTRGLNINNS